MNRREFLSNCSKTLIGGVLLSNDFLNVRLPSRKPNILVIMTDDQGSETVQCYGADKQIDISPHRQYQTPRLDELAATGIQFNHGYTQPLCTPSRVQIMTGKYNFRNYISFGALRAKEETFAHMLKRHGYKTCVAGKWQLWGGGDGVYADRAGFDEYCLWALEDRGSRYAYPQYRKNGELIEELATNPVKYGPDIYTEFIMDFFEKHQDEPIFAYFPMCLPHGPFQPTPDSDTWDDTGETMPWTTDRVGLEYYADMVNYLDKCVGRLVDKLDELEIRENTLIIFTTDNGTPTAITSQMQDGTVIEGAKGYTIDAGYRVPFIANWKGTAPSGFVTDYIVDISDILPTLADVSGAKLPENKSIDGKSFAPLLRGEKYTPREWTFCWYDPMQDSGQWSRKICAKDHYYKLYDSGQLYYIPDDPKEENPIQPGTESPDAQAARVKLQKALDEMGYA